MKNLSLKGKFIFLSAIFVGINLAALVALWTGAAPEIVSLIGLSSSIIATLFCWLIYSSLSTPLRKVFANADQLTSREIEESSKKIIDLVAIVNEYSNGVSQSIQGLSSSNSELTQAVNEQAESV